MLPSWRISSYENPRISRSGEYIFIVPEQTRKPPALSANMSGGDAWIEHLAQQAEHEAVSRASLPSTTPCGTRFAVVIRFSELACEIVPGLSNRNSMSHDTPASCERIKRLYDSPALYERIKRLWGCLHWEIAAVPERTAAHVCRVLSEQSNRSDKHCRHYCRRQATIPHDLWDYARAIFF